MPEECSDEREVIGHGLHLGIHAPLELLALAQGAARRSHTPDMAPDQFIRIEIGRIPQQQMQREGVFGALPVCPDDGLLVRRQTIDDQMHGLAALGHHVLEQPREPLARERSLVSLEPRMLPWH